MRAFPFRPDRHGLLAIPALALLLTACENATSPLPPPVTGTVTVDAAASWAWLGIVGDSLKPVAVSNPAAEPGWDLGLFATTVTTNGGAAGPGGVEVACVCANAGATAAELQVMTPESELPDFESVSASSLAAAAFSSDALAPAISGWYSGTGAAAGVTPGRSWIIREGTASVVLAKFRITQIQNASATAMGLVTFEFAVQGAPGQPFGPVVSGQVNVGASPVYLDLTTAAVTDQSNWDLMFDGWTIRTNGGVSGNGSVRAVLDTSTPFATIDAAYAATAPAQAFSADSWSGVFTASRWYAYNITGTDNQIWPTFNVYLLRRGSTVFKVQLIGYYGPTGTPRQITVRYQRIAG